MIVYVPFPGAAVQAEETSKRNQMAPTTPNTVAEAASTLELAGTLEVVSTLVVVPGNPVKSYNI